MPTGVGYRAKGFRDGLNSTQDMYDSWHSKHGKQSGKKYDEHLYLDGKPVARGAYVTAQEYYFEGFQRGREARKKNPRKVLKSGRLTPVRFSVKNKTYTGKAKLVGGKVKVFVTPNVASKINPKANPRHTYSTEKAFRKALAKYTASGELVTWYGTDHGWVIETKRIVK